MKKRIVLKITVYVEMNGEQVQTIKDNLLNIASNAVANGMITGNSEAELEHWDAKATCIKRG